jgi:hypothetical protein
MEITEKHHKRGKTNPRGVIVHKKSSKTSIKGVQILK